MERHRESVMLAKTKLAEAKQVLNKALEDAGEEQSYIIKALINYQDDELKITTNGIFVYIYNASKVQRWQYNIRSGLVTCFYNSPSLNEELVKKLTEFAEEIKKLALE